MIKGVIFGNLENNSTFNRKTYMDYCFERVSISHSINSIYEGKTFSYFVEKPNDNDLLYQSKNEDLKMIIDPILLKPFIPFSKDSDGGFNSAFYCSDDDKGDIFIDCSYKKFILDMGIEEIPRYIQNIVAWLADPEKHVKDNVKDGSEYRPKKVDISIDWNDKWKKFKIDPLNPKNMKTLFTVDFSGSI